MEPKGLTHMARRVALGVGTLSLFISTTVASGQVAWAATLGETVVADVHANRAANMVSAHAIVKDGGSAGARAESSAVLSMLSMSGTLYAVAAPEPSSHTTTQPGPIPAAAPVTCEFGSGAYRTGPQYLLFEASVYCPAGSTWTNQAQLRQSANPSFVINGDYVLNPTEVSSGEDLYPIPGAQYYIVQYVSAEAPPDEIWKTGPSYCLGYGSKTVVCIITYSPFTFP